MFKRKFARDTRRQKKYERNKENGGRVEGLRGRNLVGKCKPNREKKFKCTGGRKARGRENTRGRESVGKRERERMRKSLKLIIV